MQLSIDLLYWLSFFCWFGVIGACCFCNCGDCATHCTCDSGSNSLAMPTQLLLTLTNACGTYETILTFTPGVNPGDPCGWFGTIPDMIQMECVPGQSTQGCMCGSVVRATFALYCSNIAVNNPQCFTDRGLPATSFLLTGDFPVPPGTASPVGFFDQLTSACVPLSLNFIYGQSDPLTLGCANPDSSPCSGDSYRAVITEVPPSPPACEGDCTWRWDGSKWVLLSSSCSAGCSCVAPNTPGLFVGQEKGTLCQ